MLCFLTLLAFGIEKGGEKKPFPYSTQILLQTSSHKTLPVSLKPSCINNSGQSMKGWGRTKQYDCRKANQQIASISRSAQTANRWRYVSPAPRPRVQINSGESRDIGKQSGAVVLKLCFSKWGPGTPVVLEGVQGGPQLNG